LSMEVGKIWDNYQDNRNIYYGAGKNNLIFTPYWAVGSKQIGCLQIKFVTTSSNVNEILSSGLENKAELSVML
jgi:hypothetical protein